MGVAGAGQGWGWLGLLVLAGLGVVCVYCLVPAAEGRSLLCCTSNGSQFGLPGCMLYATGLQLGPLC